MVSGGPHTTEQLKSLHDATVQVTRRAVALHERLARRLRASGRSKEGDYYDQVARLIQACVAGQPSA